MYKDIKGYESYGVIDEYGNVKTHKRAKFRKSFPDNRGNQCLFIGKRKELVKNLIAKTFLRDFNESTEQVIFINGNKDCLHFSNLQIIPISAKYKLSQDAAKVIREKYSNGFKQVALAREFGVSRTTISKIINSTMY